MASLASALPPEGSALWRRTRSSVESKVKHVVIREASVCSEPTVHTVYKIDVLTKDNHWMVFRRYSQFHSLHQKLVKHYSIPRDLLPPKRLSGNLSQQVIDQRKQLLERYLQKLINSNLDVSQSSELMEFLSVPDHDIIDVTTELTRLLYFHGEEFLQKGKPFKLSPRQLFSITERRKLPLDPTGSCDISLDPAHLFDFITRLNSLVVVTEGNSVCCMAFDVGMFRSLEELQITGVSMAKIEGLSQIQQQLRSLTVSQSLSSLKELLIESVVNKRPLSQQQQQQAGVMAESWRLLATARLADNRIVVQPWKCLRVLYVSNNEIKCLDQSLKLLPCLEELDISHNHLISLDLSHLCLPMLTKLNLSHNAIAEVLHHRKVIESVAELDLSYNKLTTLDGLCGFIGVTFLNVKHNIIHRSCDLDQVMKLGHLSQLHLIGNPVCLHPSHRTILLAKFSLANRNTDAKGIVLSLIMTTIMCNQHQSEDLLNYNSPVSNQQLVPAQKLQWTITPESAKDIKTAKINFDIAVSDCDHQIIVFEDYGKGYVKSQKLSADSFIQMAIQLTFYKMHGHLVATYEASTTRRFLYGRCDIIRGESLETLSFCKAMLDPTATDTDRATKLIHCVETHRERAMEAISGQAFDRHLFGLKLAAGNDLPSLYKDPTYTKSIRFCLSTSQINSKYEMVSGYGEMYPDGYACCYNPLEEKFMLAICSSRQHPQTDTTKFGATLMESFREMRTTLDCYIPKAKL